MGYGDTMIKIRQTSQFSNWFRTLRDHNVRARINIRIRRLPLGNPGDDKSSQDEDIAKAKVLAREL
jgi:putative component of toxin-antitoxin plasmid stabilization module